MVPQSIEILLTRTQTQHMTSSRLTKYEQKILAAEMVSLKKHNDLNPATLFPLSESDSDGDKFDYHCLKITEFRPKPSPDIQDVPLEESALT